MYQLHGQAQGATDRRFYRRTIGWLQPRRAIEQRRIAECGRARRSWDEEAHRRLCLALRSAPRVDQVNSQPDGGQPSTAAGARSRRGLHPGGSRTLMASRFPQSTVASPARGARMHEFCQWFGRAVTSNECAALRLASYGPPCGSQTQGLTNLVFRPSGHEPLRAVGY